MHYHEYRVDKLRRCGDSGGGYRCVHRGVSHVSHFEAESGLESPHKEQVQVPLFAVGNFIPAAAKSKPFTGAAGGAATGAGVGAGAEAPFGDGVSQVSHLDAKVGFDRPHSEHIQVSLLTVGAFMPAAAKLNP